MSLVEAVDLEFSSDSAKSVSSEHFQYIQHRLHEIEEEHHIKILFAVESGSRSWGFESADSDYDVRFVYMHKKDWYLQIKPQRDVVEYPIIDDYDYAGWDLKKALFLISKSNQTISEWLKSPIVYIADKRSVHILQDINQKYFSPVSAMHHYLNMARKHYDPIQKREKVKLKKYFYVLRPLWACRWMQKFREVAPIEFNTLLTLLNSKSPELTVIRDLMKIKKSGVETGDIDRIEILDVYIEEQFISLTSAVNVSGRVVKPSDGELDSVFRQLLGAW